MQLLLALKTTWMMEDLKTSESAPYYAVEVARPINCAWISKFQPELQCSRYRGGCGG